MDINVNYSDYATWQPTETQTMTDRRHSPTMENQSQYMKNHLKIHVGARISLMLTVTLSLWAVQRVHANTEHWIGNPGVTATTNWSDAANWTGANPTNTYNNEVEFWSIGAVGAPGVINNVLDNTNATGVSKMGIWQLDYTPTNGNLTTLIAPGAGLLVANGNGRLYIGADLKNNANLPAPANAVETVTFTGSQSGITMIPASGSQFYVDQGSPSADAHNIIVDMSGLGSFQMQAGPASRFLVANAHEPRSHGTVYLAMTNSIVLGNDLQVGYLGNSYSNSLPIALYLGMTNWIQTGYSVTNAGNVVVVGLTGCTNAILAFNPAFVGGANIPVAYFSSPATVNNGRIDTWTICNPNGGKVPGYAINDFSGGYVSIMANNFRLGISGAAAGSGLPSIDALGVLTFTNGIVDANTLTVGLQQTTSGGAARGVINVGASATLKVNTLMTLAAVAGTANPATAGTINLNGGTLIANAITNGAGVGTINMTNATWSVSINPGATTSANATVTNFNTGGPTNYLVINFASLPSTYPATSHLVHYQTLGGVGITNMGFTLPTGGGYAGYLTNNTAANTIDLVLTAGASPSALVWTGTDTLPTWADSSGINWTNLTGTPTVYHQLDSVRFDDTASGSTGPTLTGMLTPGGLLVTNASKTYTFGGSGWLAGAGVTGNAIPGGLVKQGTGTLILNNTTPDTYLGGITISGGILQIGDGSTAGGGSLGLASGPVANSAGLVVNRPLGDIFAAANVISGAGGITNIGAGTLQLNSANTFTGPLAVNAGIVQLGNSTALGTTAGATYVASGATLDFNGINPGAEPITAQGVGTDGNGALINNSSAGTPQPTAVTLAGDITLGGSARWDLRGTLGSGGHAYNVTVANTTPTYSMEWRDLAGDSALGNITVNSGTTLGWVGSTTAGTSGMLTVSGTLKFYNSTGNATLAKPLVLNNGSTVFNGGGATIITTSIALNGYDYFDIGGTSLTLSGALSGSGCTLYKENNTSPLYINGASPSFSGNVLLYAGKISLNGSLGTGTSSSISTQPGTVLAGTGVNNGPVDIYGGYTPGDVGVLGTNIFGSLTLESSALMTNDLASTASGASDLVVVNGNLALYNSTIYINPIGGTLENNRPYTLMTYSGTFNGALPLAQTVAPSIYTITLSNTTGLSPNKLQAIVTGGTPDLLVWDNASTDGEWNVNSSGNWSNTVSHVPNDVFLGSEAVLFNDSITNTVPWATNIDIAGGVVVIPSVITNNSTVNYALSGSGSISGGASIVKMGTGTLAISNANDFTGAITISGGTVVGASATALGSTVGSLTATNGGTLDAGFPLGAKPIFVSGAGVGGNGAIVNNNSPHIWDSNGGLANTVTLLGDTTFGGSNRWDLGSSMGATLSTGGKPYSVSVTGPAGAYKEWQAVTIDPKLTNINILASQLGVKGMTNLGDPNGTVTIYTNAQLTFWGGSNYTKNYYVKSGGTMLVRQDGPVFNLNMTLEDGAIFHSIDNVKTMTAPVNLLGVAQFLSDSAICTFSNVISGPAGGINWSGNSSQFAFAAANTYQGPTLIGNGLTLALLGGGSISSSSLIFFGGTDTNAFRIDVTGKNDQKLTLASGQTLEGAGRVNGALLASPGAMVSPGTNTTFGAIGAAGAVTLNGTTALKIYNPTANDAIQSSTSIAFGDTLSLEFIPGNLAAGNSWKLFNAPSYSGSFTLSPASPGSGLVWDTSRLAIDGTLWVISTSPPDITSIAVGGGNVILSGTNGSPNAYYSVLSTTNVALPLNQWLPLATNRFDGSGNFNWTNAIVPGEPTLFYRLQLQ